MVCCDGLRFISRLDSTYLGEADNGEKGDVGKDMKTECRFDLRRSISASSTASRDGGRRGDICCDMVISTDRLLCCTICAGRSSTNDSTRF
jgi:hypothetical protein